MNLYLYIFLGGGLGSLARFGVSSIITSGFKTINPIGTMAANILSMLVLGTILLVASRNGGLSENMKALLIVGFCGGFSTFSTFSFETFELFRTSQYLFATANVLVSVALGLVVLFVFAKSIGS